MLALTLLACFPLIPLGDGAAVGLSRPDRSVDGRPMGSEIRVYSRSGGGVLRYPKLNPWKLTTADVDGDGSREVVVGVYKKSPYDPVMEKRVFVYEWTGELLKPKWLGSRLTRRFDDFAFIGGRLLALERAGKDAPRIGLYEWNGFGFRRLSAAQTPRGLRAFDGSGRSLQVFGERERFHVSVVGDRIELQRMQP